MDYLINLFVIGCFVFIFYSIIYYILYVFGITENKRKLNELFKCSKCKLFHREYQRLLFLKDNECPHCHDKNNFYKVKSYDKEAGYKHLMAKKISMWKAYKINKLFKKNEENEFLEKQLERYLEIQEEQLIKMKEKKDELIKSGAFDK